MIYVFEFDVLVCGIGLTLGFVLGFECVLVVCVVLLVCGILVDLVLLGLLLSDFAFAFYLFCLSDLVCCVVLCRGVGLIFVFSCGLDVCFWIFVLFGFGCICDFWVFCGFWLILRFCV